MAISVIAVIGGPRAGRSTFLVLARDWLEKHGYRVFILPEAAAELITMGASPSVLGPRLFQERLLRSLFLHEDEAIAMARELEHETGARVAICCPGGVPDAASRIDLECYTRLLTELGWHPEAIRERYTLALHLVSPATVLEPEAFDKLACACEREISAEQARELEGAVALVWKGHRNLFKIGYAAQFEQKLLFALQGLAEGLGETPPTGIERVFRIDPFSEERLPKDAVKRVYIEDYLLTFGVFERQVRKRIIADDVQYVYSEQMLIDRDGSRFERSRFISHQEYQQLLCNERDTALWSVEKTCYAFAREGQQCEVEAYGGRRGGLALLRVGVQEADEAVMWLPGISAKEVTGDRRYTSRELANPSTFEE